MVSLGLQVAAQIRSGDVTTARALGARQWSPAESRAITSACSVWGVDPATFGIAPKPTIDHPALAALRRHLAL